MIDRNANKPYRSTEETRALLFVPLELPSGWRLRWDHDEEHRCWIASIEADRTGLGWFEYRVVMTCGSLGILVDREVRDQSREAVRAALHRVMDYFALGDAYRHDR